MGPKTAASAAKVPVIPALRSALAQHGSAVQKVDRVSYSQASGMGRLSTLHKRFRTP